MKKSKILLVVTLTFVLTGCASPVQRGMDSIKDKKYEDAITSFEEITTKDNTSEKEKKAAADAYRGMGIAYWELKDYTNAKEAFGQAIEYGTKETSTLYNFLGTCEMQLKNYEDAVIYYEKGLEIADGSSELMQEMAFNQIVAYENLKDWDNAKAKMSVYIAAYPEDVEAKKEAEFLETR